jgi:hypothetical protein
MSSFFKVQHLTGRVVITHDMPHATVISELSIEQADVLLQQLQIAVRHVLQGLRQDGIRSDLPQSGSGTLPQSFFSSRLSS